MTTYDEVPYQSVCFPQTHPDRLATLGRLFGLHPAPVDACRVLELGCAMGANLIPMAFGLPNSVFVGVDLSIRQIRVGLREIDALALSNVRLEHASILDVDDAWGEFDYIVCHGVYSWVAPEVQEKILAIARTRLAPDGIAFVSYNTYPGWHLREATRHMMRYHARQFSDIPERIEQARALLEFLAENAGGGDYYAPALQAELKLVTGARDSYVYHEHLEEINEPVYFHEFVQRAERQGLRYLGEAEFSSMLAAGFGADVAETLDDISSDIVHAEQYMDFLRNRFFRQTLLCHRNHNPVRHIEATDLEGLFVASAIVPDGPSQGESATFRTPDGRRVQTSFPYTRAALAALAASWPRALDLATLRSRVEACVGVSGDSRLDSQWAIVLDDLLHCFSLGTVELRTSQVRAANVLHSTPRVSRLVASQAKSGGVVANHRHEPVTLDEVGRVLASWLDGSRRAADLVSELAGSVARGEVTLALDGATAEASATDKIVETTVGETLDSFLRQALLDE